MFLASFHCTRSYYSLSFPELQVPINQQAPIAQVEGKPWKKNRKSSCFVRKVWNGISEYLLYCEMLFNLFEGLRPYRIIVLHNVIQAVIYTIRATIDKAGLEFHFIDGECMIVEKNAVAIEVAEETPELSDVVIEYNRYMLKGDLTRKKEILHQIASALEPIRKEITGINKRMTDDFFFMVNDMNIRHNNCDPMSKAYSPKVAAWSLSEQEEWYDIIYEQGLALFVLLGQQERNKRIDVFKKTEGNR